MRANKIVQFVCFETTLERGPFIKRWEQYTRSVDSDIDVTLQQSEKNGVYNYLAQHRCAAGELQFTFTKSGRVSRVAQTEIKAKQAGGYTLIHEEKSKDAGSDESKVFAFIIYPQTDLKVYKERNIQSKLNIYQAYYENCQYAYILEFFVKNKLLNSLVEELTQYDTAKIGTYKECMLDAV